MSLDFFSFIQLLTSAARAVRSRGNIKTVVQIFMGGQCSILQLAFSCIMIQTGPPEMLFCILKTIPSEDLYIVQCLVYYSNHQMCSSSLHKENDKILWWLLNLRSIFCCHISVTRERRSLNKQQMAVYTKTQLNIYCLGLAGHGEMWHLHISLNPASLLSETMDP